MGHSANIISSIKLPNGTTYEVHDAQALHSIEDLGLSSALVFKGTKESDSDILTLTSAKVGDVWLSTGTNTEYVCITAVSGTASSAAWEKLGNVHDAASSSHNHNVTVTGQNAASTVTGSVTIPTVSKTSKYMSATASGTTVGATGTATAVTGLNTTSIKNPTVTAVKVPNITAKSHNNASYVTTTAGSAASWSASVSNGVLSFSWTANTPTKVTATTVPTTSCTFGSDLEASKVTTSLVTVATGAKDTANVLTGVEVTAQPTVTLSEGTASGTGKVGYVSAVSVGSTSASVSGTAAAQTWTQKSGTTGTPN